jgi:ferredoxin
MPKIKFVNEKKEVEVEAGANLRKVALKEGIPLYPHIHKYVNCMGFAQCASCRVRIVKGLENIDPPGMWEKFRLLWPDTGMIRLGREKEDIRLSCQTSVGGDIEVETNPEANWHGDRFWG